VERAAAKDRDHVKSLEKGLALVCLLSRHGAPLKLENLVKLSGMKKTSCFRILQTLARLDFVAQDPETRGYTIGPAMVSIGLSALASRRGVREQALPYMKEIREKTGATVNLGILSGPDIIFVERLRSAYIMEANLRVGSRLSAHCSSMGKAILAHLPEPELEEILRQIRFDRKTKGTITSIEALKRELEEIRRKGYAVNNEELEKGLFAIAAPVRNHAGTAVAALNISFPLMRHSKQEALRIFVPLIMGACRKISLSLGFQPD